jgi:hypothetical protein
MADTSSEHRREWNVYTLKEHFDGLASARDKAVEAALIAQKGEVAAALAAAKEAVLKAEISTDKRFQAANGFREAMLDQQKTSRWQFPRSKTKTSARRLQPTASCRCCQS